jgi:hypothetical protein
MKRIVCSFVVGLAACSSNPPAPDWQMNAKSASERSTAAYLTGNTRIDAAELARARAEVARTGRADLLARVELAHCAAQVASLVFEPCSAFEPLRAQVSDTERAYADRLAGRPAVPEPTALQGMADPLARLIAAGVLFRTERADPQVLQVAIDTASAQGWRRPLLAWLNVALRRAEAGGAGDESQALRQRIAIVLGGAPAR